LVLGAWNLFCLTSRSTLLMFPWRRILVRAKVLASCGSPAQVSCAREIKFYFMTEKKKSQKQFTQTSLPLSDESHTLEKPHVEGEKFEEEKITPSISDAEPTQKTAIEKYFSIASKSMAPFVAFVKKEIGDIKNFLLSLRNREPFKKVFDFLAPYEKYFYPAAKILRPIVMVFFAVSAFGVFALLMLFLIFGRDLPDVRTLKAMNFSETTHIYDRSGHELYKIFGNENREYVTLHEINSSVIQATIAIEDKKFYHHYGFDPIGMVRAQLKNFQSDNISQGASTITQQLAKNIFLSSERTYQRKIKELLLAIEIEFFFHKDEILELYFNKLSYGANAYGIEAAAQTYFGVPANCHPEYPYKFPGQG